MARQVDVGYGSATDHGLSAVDAMTRSDPLNDAGVSEREAEVLALVGEHLSNAEIAGRLLGYAAADRQLMYGLTIPQVAATLAVALVAYSTRNAAGQRLIDEPVLNATVVLVILSSLIGLVVAGRATRRLKGQKATLATPREAA